MSKLDSLPNILGPKDDGGPAPSNGGGHNLGEALSKFDFSHLSHVDSGSQTDVGSQGLDHSDLHAALASMSPGDALDYAISQIGSADHLDAGHSDTGHADPGHADTGLSVDTSHDA
jgi:hypothetical protein